jgi:hypothetical protein
MSTLVSIRPVKEGCIEKRDILAIQDVCRDMKRKHEEGEMRTHKNQGDVVPVLGLGLSAVDSGLAPPVSVASLDVLDSCRLYHACRR